ncbi:FAD binding domain-containing protein, partial [Pisolithus thermaeus]
GRVRKSKLSPEKILQVARKSLRAFHISPLADIEWWTIYTIGQRVASKFWVEDRVFIARDAFHTHSPKAGWRSSIPIGSLMYRRLAWKIARVLRGWANPSILKTVGILRTQYTQDLIDFDKRYAALFSGKPRTSADQNGISHEEFFKAYKTAGGFTSGTGIHYGP